MPRRSYHTYQLGKDRTCGVIPKKSSMSHSLWLSEPRRCDLRHQRSTLGRPRTRQNIERKDRGNATRCCRNKDVVPSNRHRLKMQVSSHLFNVFPPFFIFVADIIRFLRKAIGTMGGSARNFLDSKLGRWLLITSGHSRLRAWHKIPLKSGIRKGDVGGG